MYVSSLFFCQANGTSTAGDDDSDKSKSEVNDEAEGGSEEVCTSYYFEISLFVFASVIVCDTCFYLMILFCRRKMMIRRWISERFVFYGVSTVVLLLAASF